jgi:hypothetical protein
VRVTIRWHIFNLSMMIIEIFLVQHINWYSPSPSCTIPLPLPEDQTPWNRSSPIVQTFHKNITQGSAVIVPGNQFTKGRDNLINIL